MKLFKKVVLPVLVAVLSVCVILSTPIVKADAASTYTVAGSSGLCGSEWNPADTNNDMTLQSDGTYTKVYTNVPAGSYELKVTKDHAWTTSWGTNGQNYKLNLTEDCPVLTIVFNPSTGKVSHVASGAADTYVVAGSSALCGIEWDPADSSNIMTAQADGTFVKAYTNVAAGSYEFKVVKNGNWDTCWGDNGQNYKITLTETCANLVIKFNPTTEVITVDMGSSGSDPVDPPVSTDTYIVAGLSTLCGSEWNATDTANKMTAQADGTFVKVYTSVAKGNYAFKVVKNGSTWIGNGDANFEFAVNAVCDVTITYNPSTNKVTYTGTSVGPVVGDKYVVAGDSTLCGSNWNTTDQNNAMEKQANGTYVKVYTNVARGNYAFKVVKNGSTWIGNGSANFEFGVTALCDVTITYNPSTNKVTYTGTNVGPSIFSPNYVTAVGNGSGKWLNGQNWSTTATSNRMTQTSDGVYEITYKNVPKKSSLQVKFAVNGSWSINWGGSFSASGKETNAVYNSGSNITFNNTYYTADITIKLDLRNYNHTTKQGAKFTITITNTHEHSFSEPTCTAAGKCVCGQTSGSALGHTYDNACDADCNVCGQTRTPADHVYENACDADCNVCGATRTPADHVYGFVCDASCDVCGELRTAADHVYDNACDADCNVCGETRVPSDHVYDSECDERCNVCDYNRGSFAHAWDNACDATCNACGQTRTPADHVYENACDPDCNECGLERTPADHVYSFVCDNTCNVCGGVREAEDHTYTNACDAHCNVCGEERVPSAHVWDNNCDNTCNVCGETRVPADHVWDNACDADCNECGEERTPADHVYDNGCDAKCNECNASREDLKHTYTDEQDKTCDVCGYERKDRVVLDGFKGCQGYVDGIIAVLGLAGLAVIKAIADKSKK